MRELKELCRELGNDDIIGRVPLWRDEPYVKGQRQRAKVGAEGDLITALLFDLYETLVTESHSTPTRAASLGVV